MKRFAAQTVGVAVLNVFTYLALYLAYAGNTGVRELIAGVAVAIIATAAVLVLSAAGSVRFRFRMADLLQMWRTPWYAIVGTFEVLQGLLRQLFTRAGAPTFIGAVRFDAGDAQSPESRGRCALAITGTTATPNFIVLDVVKEQELLLYHQIIPGEVLTMTRNLGARP